MYTFQRFIGCVCGLGLVFYMSVAIPFISVYAAEVVDISDYQTFDVLSDFDDDDGNGDILNQILNLFSGLGEAEDIYDLITFQRHCVEYYVSTVCATDNAHFDAICDYIMAHPDDFSPTIRTNGITFWLDFTPESYSQIMAYAVTQFRDYETEPASGIYRWGANMWTWTELGRFQNFSMCRACKQNPNGGIDSQDLSVWCIPLYNGSSYNYVFCTYYTEWSSAYPYLCYSYFDYYGASYQGTIEQMRLYTGTTSSGYWGARGWSQVAIGQFEDYIYSDYDSALNAFYGATVITPDADNGDGYIIPYINPSPVTLPNILTDRPSISNEIYNTYTGDEINEGDINYNIIFGDTYLVNYNYEFNVPFWLVNGSEPIYDFEHETFIDFEDTDFTISEDFATDGSFWGYVWEHLPEEIISMFVVCFVGGAAFLLLRK